MDHTESHTLDADVDEVWAMFADPASHVAKFESMGHREVEVLESRSDDETFRVVVRRLVDMDLPGFAKKVFKPTNTVTTTDEWQRGSDGGASGSQTVDVSGAPVEISARTQLTAAGERTDYRVDVSVEVKVPLIGKRLSGWAEGMVRDQLAAEFAAADRWLAGER